MKNLVMLLIALCAVGCKDCRESDRCAYFGLCTEDRGKCIAGGDAECQASQSCKDFGTCTAKDGVCTVGSDADCQRADSCTILRHCKAWKGKCFHAGDSDEDCRTLMGACSEYGWCTATNGACIAGSDADCRTSQGCKTDGKCFARDGECVKAE